MLAMRNIGELVAIEGYDGGAFGSLVAVEVIPPDEQPKAEGG